MKILNLFILSVLICFSTVGIAQAQNQEILAEMSVPELKAEMADAKIYKLLGDAQRAVENEAYCTRHRQRALTHKKSLQDLKQEYAGRANDEYFRKDEQLRRAFDNSRNQFDICFTKIANGFVRVASRQEFTAKVAAMNPRFSDKGDMPTYIALIQDELESRRGPQGDAHGQVGIIQSVFKDVQIQRAGQGKWTRVSKGTPVYINDHIKTGSRGRARLNFSDYLASENAGPTVVNIGSSSHIKIDKFIVSFNNPKKSEGIVSLLRGTVRAFTKNWGARSSFKIRAGATVCGIRGTEVAVSYDPVIRTATHILDHGDAYVEAGGRKVTMTPRTSITVTGDQIEWPVAVSEDTWLGIMNSTGDGAPGSANAEVAAVIDQAPAPAPNLSQATPRPNTAITMKEALETFRAYQYSILTEDKDTLLSLLIEPEKSKAIKSINKKGFNHYALHDMEISSWHIKCAACYEDKKRGPICLIGDHGKAIPTQKKNSDGGWTSIYVLQNEQGISYVSKRGFTYPAWQVLNRKLKKNNPVCGFDDLAINMSNGPVVNSVPDREKDGLKTLLEGIDAVLNEID